MDDIGRGSGGDAGRVAAGDDLVGDDFGQVTQGLGEVYAEESARLGLPERWQPVRLLGRGGQSEVWLALDRELEQWVAVKLFSPKLEEVELRRFRREAIFGRTLEHPHLIRIYEVLRAGDRLGVVMECCEGGSLARSR